MYQAKSFTFWVSYYDVAQELTPREQGDFYRAIMDYIFEGRDDEAKLSKTARIAFKSVKANLKRSIANRRETDANREANGRESGTNRGEVPQAESALNLKLNINPKSNPNPNASGEAVGGGEAPTCHACNRTAIRNPHQPERWLCPKCEKEVLA